MLAGDRALEAGDNSVIDELLDEFLNEEAETAPGLAAACNSTDFFSATGEDSFSDFLFDGVGTFLTDDCTPPSSVLYNQMDYSSMVAAECRASLKANFSGDHFDLSMKDAIGGGLDVPNDDLQWISSIFDEASFFSGENIQKTPTISGDVDENSDSRSQAAEPEVSHPELGIRKPGNKRRNDDSPISTLDWELGVQYENSKAANIMTTLKKRKAACGAAAAAASEGRRCLHCQTDKTPQWRSGPEGPKTLCNACGMRFKSGRLVPEYRPASSPTFVGSHHSNSHRKVLELRRQKLILDQEQEQEQKQKQRRQLLGTCSLASVVDLPPAMRPLDALFHGLDNS
ncbi:GATA transcription factor 9-like [Zingiber officinale]|uniref:GATA transcription factor 9-like n=1 Tax=Zingiber officinale TaxID=94328 RepID=UPI001C4AB3E4|nr:GATA transcription factor 9-like [Zingiber officinale]